MDDHTLQYLQTSGLTPPKSLYANFPNDGDLQPIAAGITVFDLVNRLVNTPGQSLTMPNVIDYYEMQSIVLVIDSYIAIKIQPNAQQGLLSPGVYALPMKGVERIEINADVPFLMQMYLCTFLTGTFPALKGFVSQRYSDTTVVKVNAAGVADPLTFGSEVYWVPRTYSTQNGIKTLNQAIYGASSIVTGGYSSKLFIVRNTGAIAARVLSTVSIFGDVTAALGYVPDYLAAANGIITLGTPVIVPAGQAVVIASSQIATTMTLLAVAATAANPGQSTQLICEYLGQIDGG